jgi:ATP-binding cassette subfamily B protein
MQGFNNQTKASDFKTRDIKVLSKLMPYLLKMRTRVILATLFLIVAKLANVAVPVALKGIVDALDQPDVLVVLPLGLLFAYGVRQNSAFF